MATGIIKDAGNYTFRVWLQHADSDTTRRLVVQFGRMGCLIEGYSDQLFGLSCTSRDASAVAEALHGVSRRACLSTRRDVSERPNK